MAAAKLGVWKKISSSLMLFMRRSSSIAAAAEAVVWKKGSTISSGSESVLNKEKSLYLSFYEVIRCRGAADQVNQVVRRISLNSDGDDGGKEEWLKEAAPLKRCGGDSEEWRFCGRFGSQILFPTGRNLSYTHINAIDTSILDMKFHKFKSFSTYKNDPVLVEINGKLYCIDHCNLGRPFEPTYRPFEVLDPEDDFKWRPLVNPPLTGAGPALSSVLEGSNKILSWAWKKEGVYCFDVTKPENGWTDTCSDLSGILPHFSFHRRVVFIHNHHPDLGDFYLTFTYGSEFTLYPFFLSPNCDSFQWIDQPIQLPQKLCSNYIPFMNGCELEPPICTDFDFVDLGGKKFCLLLNKFYSDDPVQGKNTGTLILITFEYDVVPNGDKVNIQTRLLGTRRFRYHASRVRKRTSCLHLTGAFVL